MVDRRTDTLFQNRITSAPLLFGVAVTVTLGDLITTTVGVSLGITEGNPLINLLITELGLLGLVVIKIASLAGIIALPSIARQDRDQLVLFRLGCGLYSTIVGLAILINIVAILLS